MAPEAAASHNRRDPAGFLHIDEFGRSTNSSSTPTVVKVVGTSRDDLNGLLGFVTSYNQERERYMVKMAYVDVQTGTVAPQVTVMALKATNLQQASTFEHYKAQLYQITTDPAIRQKLRYYYESASTRVSPYGKLEYVLGGVLLGFLVLLYVVGFTGTVMLVSALLLVGMIVMEDVKQKNSWKVMLAHFPARSKVVLEKQFPFVRGKLNETVSAGIVGVLLAFTIQAVFFARNKPSSTPTTPATAASPTPGLPPSSLPGTTTTTTMPRLERAHVEQYYELGYTDAIEGKERGASIQQELQRLLEEEAKQQEQDEALEPIPEIPYTTQPQQHTTPATTPKSWLSKVVNFRTMGSLFYFYRLGTQFGIDPSTGIFSLAQLAANLQHQTPAWQKGMMAFSLYNLISNIFL